MRNRQKGFSLIELLIVVAIILIIAAIAIPNLIRSKMAANEASAVASLRTYNTSIVAYETTYQTAPSGTSLAVLGPASTPSSTAADLVDQLLGSATPVKSGYSFTYAAGSASSTGVITTYTILADPSNTSTGQRHFFTDQSGVIRANTSAVAAVTDSPIGN